MGIFDTEVLKALFLRFCHCLVKFHSGFTYSEGKCIGPFYLPLKYKSICCTQCGKVFYGMSMEESIKKMQGGSQHGS
jgi:hypothetical protein